jgi:putative hydrolase of the HAD superfamily
VSNIEVVIFDVYNTLINLKTDEEKPGVYQFLSAWLSYKGIQINPEYLYNAYRKLIKKEIEANPSPYPDIEIGKVFQNILVDSGVSDTNQLENLVREFATLFRMQTTVSISIFPHTISVLTKLYESKKVRLAILSNSQRLFTIPELQKFNLRKYFEQILFSSDLNTSKPNPIVFNRVLELMQIRPDQAIYIGDNLFDDIWGAQQTGMKTIWIQRKGKRYEFPESFDPPTPNLKVSSTNFGELPEIIFAMN